MDTKTIIVTVAYGQGHASYLVGKNVSFLFKKENSDEIAVRHVETNSFGQASITITKDDYLEPFDFWIAYVTHNNLEKNTGTYDFTTTASTITFYPDEIGNIGISKLTIFEDRLSTKNGDLYVKFFKEGLLLDTYHDTLTVDGSHEPNCVINSDSVPALSSAGTVVYYVYYGSYEAEQNGMEFQLSGETGNMYYLQFSYKKNPGFYFNLTFLFLDAFQENNLLGSSINLYGTGNDSQYSYTINPPETFYAISGVSTGRDIRVSGTTNSTSYTFSNLTQPIDITANNTGFAKVLFTRDRPYAVYIPRIYDTFSELESPRDFNLKNTKVTLYNSSNQFIASAFTMSLDNETILVSTCALSLSATYKIEAKKWHYDTVKMNCRIGRPFNYYAYGGHYLHILKNTGAYTGDTGFVSYKKLKAITLEREEDVCMTARELNDYKNSFSGIDQQVLNDIDDDGESGYCQGIRKVVPSMQKTYQQAVNEENLAEFKKKYISPLHTISLDAQTSYTLPHELENEEDIRPTASYNDVHIEPYTKYGDDSKHCYVLDECIIPETTGDTEGYLTFYTIGNESEIILTKQGFPYEISLEFNYDSDGWANYTIGTPIHLYENENVKFRAKPNTILPPNFSKSENDYYQFNVSAKTYVKGNIKYLLNGNLNNAVTSTTSNYCFYRMFFRQEELRMLNFNDLKITFENAHDYSFSEMFEGCNNLKYGSDMSSITTAGGHAFERMYKDCVRLEKAGSLSGLINIEDSACKEMFFNCKNLKFAVSFGFTTSSTIGTSGCCSMYEDCESLNSTPLLTSIKHYNANYCCAKMFKGCKNIQIMQPIQSTEVGIASFYAMFSGCTNLVTSSLILNEEVDTYAGTASVEVSGCSHMYIGCTNLNSGAFRLQLEQLNDCCYQYMFYDCVKLKNSQISTLPAEKIPNYGYYYMFYNCQSLDDLKDIISESASTIGKYGCAYMFAYCKSLNFLVGTRVEQHLGPYILTKKYVVLSATDIGEGAYNHMFYNCDSLTSPSNIIICATTLNNHACASMFEECDKIVSVVDLSNITKIGYKSCYAMYKNSGQYLSHTKFGVKNYTYNDFVKKAFVIQNDYNLYFEDENTNNSYSVCTYPEYMDTGAYNNYTLSLLTNKASFSAIRGSASTITELPSEGNINGDIYTVNGQKYIWYEDRFCRLLSPIGTLPSPTYPTYQTYDVITVTGNSQYQTYILINDWIPIDLGASDYISNTFENMFYGSNVIIASMRINTRDLFGPHAFEYMFSNCKCLETGPELCDAAYFDAHPEIWRNVAECAFDHSFSDCTYLTNNLYISGHSFNKPYLIIGTYGRFSCRSMYENCYNLKHYTSVHPYGENGVSHACFQRMFANCFSLPEFEKLALSGCTNMKQDCYQQMFFKCESLKVAPKLPATTLYSGCYSYMFHKANSYSGTVSATYTYTAKKTIQRFYNPIDGYYFPNQTVYQTTGSSTFSENYYSDGYAYSHGGVNNVPTEQSRLSYIDGYAFSRVQDSISNLMAVNIPTVYRVKYEFGDDWVIIRNEDWSLHNGQTYVYSETGPNSVYRTGTTSVSYNYDTVVNFNFSHSSSTIVGVYDTGVNEISANFKGYNSEAALMPYTEQWVSCLKDSSSHKFYKNPNWNGVRGINGIPNLWTTYNYNSSP